MTFSLQFLINSLVRPFRCNICRNQQSSKHCLVFWMKNKSIFQYGSCFVFKYVWNRISSDTISNNIYFGQDRFRQNRENMPETIYIILYMYYIYFYKSCRPGLKGFNSSTEPRYQTPSMINPLVPSAIILELSTWNFLGDFRIVDFRPQLFWFVIGH